MKKAAALLLCLCVLLTGCGGQSAPDAACDLIVATDLHYIAPSLTDQGPLFTALTDDADGKLMCWIEELTDAFLAEVTQRQPEALILTGDLSFNGAVRSHEALAEKLRAVEAAGVPVLVTTGNHDLDNPSAAAFSGESYRPVPSASAEDFRRIYADFGYDEALSQDGDSLSYTYALNDSTRLLLLDANTAHDPCGLSKETLRWVEAQLRQARRDRAAVLSFGHQNLLQQTMFRRGYVMDGSEALRKLFARYGVPLYCSGHLHVQHYLTEQGGTEICTSALSVSPCQYGLLRAAGGRLRYETRAVDVSAWARAGGRTEPELLDFARTAADYFDAHTRRQAEESLALFAYTPEEIACMTEALCAWNRAYFSGNLRDLDATDPEGKAAVLWQHSASPYGAYLNAIRSDAGRDFRTWER